MMIERAASASLFALLVAACSSSAVPSSVEGSVDPNKAPASAGNPSSNAPTAPTPEALSRSSCFIDGFFYSRGDSNPLDACAACLPLYGDQHWTALPHGSACGNHGVCTAGVCVQPPHGPGGPGPGPGAADCVIGTTPYAIGAENPANACQVCAPIASTTAWTNALAGKSCPGGTCNAGTCDATVAIPSCTIAGVGYETNETNPTNICEVCSPSTSTTAWSNITPGAACGNGKACFNGACKPVAQWPNCTIGGVSYTPGTPSPTNKCKLCQPRQSMNGFTNAPDGMPCGPADQCISGQCESLLP